MYKPAARSSCSFKPTQVTRWLLHSIVPFYLWETLEKNVPFSVFKHRLCQSSYFQPYKLYVSEISNQYSIYWAYKKFIFPKFKNRAGMPTHSHWLSHSAALYTPTSVVIMWGTSYVKDYYIATSKHELLTCIYVGQLIPFWLPRPVIYSCSKVLNEFIWLPHRQPSR